MSDTYYSKNKSTVLQKQRAKRSTPEAKAKTREYSRQYYQKNKHEILAKIQQRKQNKNISEFNIEYGTFIINFD